MPCATRCSTGTPRPSTANLIDATVDGERIIDRDFQHTEASRAGRAERYGHGTSPHTLNVWWARRPLSTMHMIVHSALAGTSDSSSPSSDEAATLQSLRQKLLSTYGRPPRVLDPFGGGGTSAMAAACLGCEVDTADVNELAAFIQRTALEYPAAFADQAELASTVQSVGEELLTSLGWRTKALFPLRRHNITNYLWSHSQRCRNCGFQFMLARRTGIRHRTGTPQLNLIFRIDGNRQSLAPGADDQAPSPANWRDKRGTVCCPNCGTRQRARIGRSSDKCCALIQSQRTQTKKYHCATAFGRTPAPADRTLLRYSRNLQEALNLSLPEAELRRWSGVINPAIYGMRRYSDLFNRRQTCVFLELTLIFQQAFDDYKAANGEAKAKAVFALLASLFDQLIDWNCRLSMWIPQNEQVGRAFCGPGVSMLWDYCETDPCGAGPANLWSKLNRIVNGICSLADMRGCVRVHHCSARQLPMDSQSFDAVITDPPYYDNIHYAALADFFYTWKRLPLQRLFPQEFSAPLSSADDEIVCSDFRHGKDAHHVYITMLADALTEAQRVLRRGGRIAVVFGHASLRGWVALIEAYRKAGLKVSSAEPLGIERNDRPRAIRSNAVNTCTVFISGNANHKPRHQPPMNLATKLITTGWSREDAAMAEFASRIVPLINHPHMNPIEDHLTTIQKTINTSFPEFNLKHRRS